MGFVIGLLLGISLLLLLAFWLHNRKVDISWYEWLIAVIGISLLIFGLQNYFVTSGEYEPTAPGMFLLVFGLPGAALLLIAGVLTWWGYIRKHKSGKPAVA